jgi:hypothetical protein
MRHRCMREKHPQYKAYGGRGITVCKRWMKFENFFEDMGNAPTGLSLDRIDNNSGYSKDNCRWATKIEQNNNTRGNKRILFNGENLTLSQWSYKMKIPSQTISDRLAKGWSPEKCLSKKSFGVIPIGIGGWRKLNKSNAIHYGPYKPQ